MKQLLLGGAVLLFGVFVGGIGVASAGIGIGIPMIPLGIYLTYRGWRIYKHEEEVKENSVVNPEPLEPLEKTRIGKLGIGIILLIVGAGTTAFLIGIPIIFLGVWFIYKAYESEIRSWLNRS